MINWQEISLYLCSRLEPRHNFEIEVVFHTDIDSNGLSVATGQFVGHGVLRDHISVHKFLR